MASPRPNARVSSRAAHLLRSSLVLLLMARVGAAQSAEVAGAVRDETGGALPGVVVELTAGDLTRRAETDTGGAYRFAGLGPGRAELVFALAGFATARQPIVIPASGSVRFDAVLSLILSEDVTVRGRASFADLGDAAAAGRSLVGIARSATQGVIDGSRLRQRPIMRAGDVLESVPGMVISQHSGEGKANQYYVRGFNLDHGTDFATTVAGIPVNMPTHGHGHGYTDLNFLIPELVSGVRFSKGPYFAEHGDFATAGAATIDYADSLPHPLVQVKGGGHGFGRALIAASSEVGPGRLLAALEMQQSDGPWERPDRFRRLNGLVRYSRGDRLNGITGTAMAYRGVWDSTDQIPARAVAAGRLDRFGSIDRTTGGDSHRFAGSIDWRRARGHAATALTAFGLAYDLDLFSNFTYFLHDPDNGDQFRQADRRIVSGGALTHRRLADWAGRAVQNQIGAEIRHDRIANVGLYHTVARRPFATIREDSVVQTSVAAHAQNETVWTPWLRTLAGVRLDGYRFQVQAGEPVNSGTSHAGLVSPKSGAVLGPWRGTELYVNAGLGYHRNDARGATIAVDPRTGEPADRVTPLARARGAEVGVRTARIPHLQSSLALWTLSLDSELIFVGDAGTTEAGRPSRRYGIEWSSSYSPRAWLTLDADLAVSRARFTDRDPAGQLVPGAVATVVAAGATVDSLRRFSGSVRWRYFGSRPLVEDGAVRSRPTSLVGLQAGYSLSETVRIAIDFFNVLDAEDSDVEYFYASRLRGEPAGGVEDFHYHPTVPRTARVILTVGF